MCAENLRCHERYNEPLGPSYSLPRSRAVQLRRDRQSLKEANIPGLAYLIDHRYQSQGGRPKGKVVSGESRFGYLLKWIERGDHRPTYLWPACRSKGRATLAEVLDCGDQGREAGSLPCHQPGLFSRGGLKFDGEAQRDRPNKGLQFHGLRFLFLAEIDQLFQLSPIGFHELMVS